MFRGATGEEREEGFLRVGIDLEIGYVGRLGLLLRYEEMSGH